MGNRRTTRELHIYSENKYTNLPILIFTEEETITITDIEIKRATKYMKRNMLI